MVDWNKIANKVSDTIDKRGGAKSVEEDLQELSKIAEGEGTMMDKLKAAKDAIKEPGAHHDTPAQPAAPAPAPTEAAPQPPTQNG